MNLTPHRHPIVCITGGIGAGKSVVSRVLRLKGFRVYDCDSAAKSLMENSPELKEALCRVAGHDIYDVCGRLQRKLMAERLFSSDDLRAKINALVHEAVRNEIAAISAECDGVLFVETAIPAVSKLDSMSDAIWLVDAPAQIRIERACGRDGADRCQIEKRMEAQASEFASLPPETTAIISNDGNTPLLPQIDNLLKQIID